jgi:hypothetical protein
MTNAQGQVSVIQMQWSPEAGAKDTTIIEAPFLGSGCG